MVPLCCIYTAKRRRRQYIPFRCTEWNTSHPRQIFQNIFTKAITIKKKKDYYYIELNLFFQCWLACFKFVRNKNVQVFRIGLTLFWQYTCQNICDSFFLNWRCFNVFFFFFCYCFFFFFVFFFLFVLFFVVVVVFVFCFCKLRQTNFRHRCFEKEESFFISWLYFW